MIRRVNGLTNTVNSVTKITDGFSENRVDGLIMGSRKRNFADQLYQPGSLELAEFSRRFN